MRTCIGVALAAMLLPIAAGALSVLNEDLTENFCTNNEHIDLLRRLHELETTNK